MKKQKEAVAATNKHYKERKYQKKSKYVEKNSAPAHSQIRILFEESFRCNSAETPYCHLGEYYPCSRIAPARRLDRLLPMSSLICCCFLSLRQLDFVCSRAALLESYLPPVFIEIIRSSCILFL